MSTRTPTLDNAARSQGAMARSRFGQQRKEKASEPEGSEAVIPVISLVALLHGDAEAASGSTRQHQNASLEASSRYSRSATNPVRVLSMRVASYRLRADSCAIWANQALDSRFQE